MKKFLEQLDKVKVIDKYDIIKVKGYIQKKYPENDLKENTRILSETINKIIYNQLDGLSKDSKLSAKNNIIKNTLASNKGLITLGDVYRYVPPEEVKYINSINKVKENLNCDNEINVKVTNEVEVTSIDNKKVKRVLMVFMCIFIVAILGSKSKSFYFYESNNENKKYNYTMESNKEQLILTKYPNIHLPKYMRYEEVNKEKLRDFLDEKNSILAKEPYFSTILLQAKEFNLNPIVLFSITGQEQNFVPKNSSNAQKIANNPFNVYHSWKEYNTDIKDATRIACRTVINLSKNKPKDEEPFSWIGRKYAEDKNWGKGVKSIFERLTKYVN